NEKFKIYSLKLEKQDVSKIDNTIRYNLKTKDNYIVASVFIPKIGRNVVCISTQIGCSIGCSFCNSGKVKFKRNLTCSEIVEQVLRIEKDVGKINGILFMGMGEPLLNFENLVKSIKIFVDDNAFGISRKKITVSTAGIVPNIYKLKEENLGVKLAVSLHSYDDKKRKKVIKNLNFSVEEILKAAIFYAKNTKTRLTIEYVMIKNFNDAIDDAYGLIKLLKSLTNNKKEIIKLNLIPYNFVENLKDFFPPEKDVIENFKNILIKEGFLTFIRKPYGTDINSACGQIGF
ncbi:MAG: 23S rRNA (adenine(2503)-C(2))-methyltransferase RlmN, partial [Endomicrobiia bacterium]